MAEGHHLVHGLLGIDGNAAVAGVVAVILPQIGGAGAQAAVGDELDVAHFQPVTPLAGAQRLGQDPLEIGGAGGFPLLPETDGAAVLCFHIGEGFLQDGPLGPFHPHVVAVDTGQASGGQLGPDLLDAGDDLLFGLAGAGALDLVQGSLTDDAVEVAVLVLVQLAAGDDGVLIIARQLEGLAIGGPDVTADPVQDHRKVGGNGLRRGPVGQGGGIEAVVVKAIADDPLAGG